MVTSDSPDIARLMQLDEADFSAQVQAHFQHRLGEMELVGPRHHYPLVATYARQFSGPRFALLGDAAVGMLPVTAHGFNLGLSGVERLSSAVASAYHAGQDWGHESVLAAYSRSQHRHAWPLFQGTNAVVKLFTDARPAPKPAAPNRAAGGAALATAEGGHRGAIEWRAARGGFCASSCPGHRLPARDNLISELLALEFIGF